MSVTSFLLDKITGGLGLSGLFQNKAEGGPSSGSSGFDIGSLIQNHQILAALGVALATGMGDGKDGLIGGGIKGIFDFAAADDIADGDGSLISELWMAYRAANVATHQSGSTLAGLAAGAALFWGMHKWEENRADHAKNVAHPQLPAPAPAPG